MKSDKKSYLTSLLTNVFEKSKTININKILLDKTKVSPGSFLESVFISLDPALGGVDRIQKLLLFNTLLG